MIVALDSRGKVLVTLVQANSNSEIMAIYFNQLIQTLDADRPGWRQDHVWCLDNAPYHKSAATLKLLKEKQVPVIFTGPHSYDASPVSAPILPDPYS